MLWCEKFPVVGLLVSVEVFLEPEYSGKLSCDSLLVLISLTFCRGRGRERGEVSEGRKEQRGGGMLRGSRAIARGTDNREQGR